MATLVLSTVGNVLGGPVGSAIGALIGQSIDQQLLAPVRRGPRVGDLNVQTSSYGTQIPRLYGVMRVAGSIIWSTDLIESTLTNGAKGQPDVTYSYSMSFAVALSSRRARSIKRIWADGQLLRGIAGDLKVGGTLRFYDGSEDQAIDSLIGSAEGITLTPAYRGLVMAVFEDLQLAEYGNRIPFLTFEVVADDAPPSVAAILSDAAEPIVIAGSQPTVVGYAAYGRSIRDAVAPLVESFGIVLFDDGEKLRDPNSGAVSIQEEEFGNSADKHATPRLQREQIASRNVPAALRLTYYDPARDFQTGEARAAAGEQGGSESQQDLAAALHAPDAKSIAQAMLGRAWATRDRLTLRLPPKRIAITPGREVTLPLSPSRWVVSKATVEGFVLVAELSPSTSPSQALAADAGRKLANADVVAGPISFALLDLPHPDGAATVFLAASSPTTGWTRQAVEITVAGQRMATETARTKSVLGVAVSVLGAGAPDLIDDINSIEVELTDHDQWLLSCADAALVSGSNLAMVGAELIQFGRVASFGGGRFRLSHLLRGRGGSELACASHAAGESFCLVDPNSLQPIALPTSAMGAMVEVAGPGTAGVSALYTGEGLRPPSPVNLSALRRADGTLDIAWTRRSRLGFAWVDEIDAPIGEMREQYRVSLAGVLGSIELLADKPTLAVAGSELAALGSGAATIEVRQIGDFAASRPATITITLS